MLNKAKKLTAVILLLCLTALPLLSCGESQSDGTTSDTTSTNTVSGDIAISSDYKIIYEKDGRFYGSLTGIPAEGDYCFKGFDKVFCAHVDENEDNLCDTCEEEIPVQPKRSRKVAPVVEEPTGEKTETEE